MRSISRAVRWTALRVTTAAAASCGLIRDDGLKAVKKLITDGFRRGKKSPRAADELRRQAAQEISRPRTGAADPHVLSRRRPAAGGCCFFFGRPRTP
jgi:hypothetical protein